MDEGPVERGSLYFLFHPGSDLYSGYGLVIETSRPDHLVGLLMVDRPRPANPGWLARVALLFGAEMPHTGAAASDWAPLVVAIGKLLLWATLIGWMLVIRRENLSPDWSCS
jgi:hypothetical protein